MPILIALFFLTFSIHASIKHCPLFLSGFYAIENARWSQWRRVELLFASNDGSKIFFRATGDYKPNQSRHTYGVMTDFGEPVVLSNSFATSENFSMTKEGDYLISAAIHKEAQQEKVKIKIQSLHHNHIWRENSFLLEEEPKTFSEENEAPVIIPGTPESFGFHLIFLPSRNQIFLFQIQKELYGEASLSHVDLVPTQKEGVVGTDGSMDTYTFRIKGQTKELIPTAGGSFEVRAQSASRTQQYAIHRFSKTRLPSPSVRTDGSYKLELLSDNQTFDILCDANLTVAHRLFPASRGSYPLGAFVPGMREPQILFWQSPDHFLPKEEQKTFLSPESHLAASLFNANNHHTSAICFRPVFSKEFSDLGKLYSKTNILLFVTRAGRRLGFAGTEEGKMGIFDLNSSEFLGEFYPSESRSPISSIIYAETANVLIILHSDGYLNHWALPPSLSM